LQIGFSLSTAIKINNLGKQYQIKHKVNTAYSYEKLSDALISPLVRLLSHNKQQTIAPSSKEVFWALRDVNLEIKQGERVGIIGRNGAGKSTLLKLISRITKPSQGFIGINGRVSSLLEVGTGFHPELTGRENIFLNGAVLGMSRSEIKAVFDQIVAFAEVEKFLDTPVKRYSSGMYVRLAFAVAAHLETEILIVDEVLAVGDMNFQKKCLGKMNEISESGRTLFFVSHNIGAVSQLCNRAILLGGGQLQYQGTVADTVDRYMRTKPGRPDLDFSRHCTQWCAIREIMVSNGSGDQLATLDLQDKILITIQYEVKQRLVGMQISLIFKRNLVDVCETYNTDQEDEALKTVEPGVYQATIHIPKMFFKAGDYTVRLTLGTPEMLFIDIEQAVHFDIEELTISTQHLGYRASRSGSVIFPGHWKTERLGV